MPEYTKNEVYRELALICSNAGLTIEYVELPDNIWGRTDTNAKNIIQMSNSDIYPTTEFATEVLGHELAHHLVENFPANEMGDEMLCNFLGKAFYELAEITAMNKAPKFWESKK